MRLRMLVMNGQRIVQIEKEGDWINQKVDKAGSLKPGIYNLYAAQQADKSRSYDGTVVYTDSTGVYQQTGKKYVVHYPQDFGKTPDIGSMIRIGYDAYGKAVVSAGGDSHSLHFSR